MTPLAILVLLVLLGLMSIPSVSASFDGSDHNALTSFVYPGMEHSGAYWTFTMAGGEYILTNTLLPPIREALLTAIIPDYEDVIPSSMGQIELAVTDITVTSFDYTQLEAVATTDKTLIAMETDLSVGMSLAFSYKQLSFPYFKDNGLGLISVPSCRLHCEWMIVADPEDHTLKLSIPIIYVTITEIDVNIDSDLSWLYDILLTLLNDMIISTLEQTITDTLASAVTSMMDGISAPPCHYVADDITLDGRLAVERSIVADTYFSIPFAYYPLETENDTCPTVTDYTQRPTVQDYPRIYDDHMIQFLWSGVAMNETIKMGASHGKYKQTFYDENDSLFTPLEWNEGLVGVVDVFGGTTSKWQIEWHLTEVKKMEFMPSGISLGMLGTLKFMDVSNPGVELFSVSSTLSMAVNPWVRDCSGTNRIDFQYSFMGLSSIKCSDSRIQMNENETEEMGERLFEGYMREYMMYHAFPSGVCPTTSIDGAHMPMEDSDSVIKLFTDNGGYMMQLVNVKPKVE